MIDPDKSPVIEYGDFIKVDIRLGVVEAAEVVPKSDKLLKLTVNLGEVGTRQILAGIGQTFKPEDLVGKQYAFVINLAPRKMMGLESHGMILATGPSMDKLSLITTDSPVAPGSRLS